MILGIDPKVDYAFKKLFGSPAHKNLLIHFLNALMVMRSRVPITDIEILNPFSVKVSPEDKLSILDVKARDADGRLYLVEMQVLATEDFPERCVYYWSKRYVEQLHQGEDYGELRPTIMISFLDHVLFDTPGHHTAFHLRADQPPELLLSDQFEMHFVELPKFRLEAEELRTSLDRWCYLMRHAEELDTADLPEPMKDETIREAVNVLEQLAMTDAERLAYEERWMGRADHAARERRYARLERETAEKMRQLAEEKKQVAEEKKQVAEEKKQVAEEKKQAARQEVRAVLRETILSRFLLDGLPLANRLAGVEDLETLERLSRQFGESATAAEFEAVLNSVSPAPRPG